MSKPDTQSDNRPRTPFVVDEMLVHVEYSDASLSAADIARTVQTRLKADKKDDNPGQLRAAIAQSKAADRVRHALDALAERSVSGQVASEPLTARRYGTELPKNTADMTFFRHDEARGGLPYGATLRLKLDTDASDTDTILELYRLATEASDDADDIRVTAMTPNWLHTSAPVHIIWGGPGTLPVPANPGDLSDTSVTDDDAPFSFHQSNPLRGKNIEPGSALETLNDALDARGESGTQPVKVYVLDTAPSADALKGAFDTWSDSNPLLASLLGGDGTLPAGNFTVTYYDDFAPDDAGRMDALADPASGYTLIDHEYEMTDHGLFVAGIIHSIAPNVQIELVQVLNQYGIGTVDTIERGLDYIAAQPDSGQTVVINASLLLAAPSIQWLLEITREKSSHPVLERVPSLQAVSNIIRNLWGDDDPATQAQHFASTHYGNIQSRIAHLTATQKQMVAAAGNDGTNGQHPPARYPAAFDTVHGVGSIATNGQMAPYSNMADRPVTDGLVTTGGMPDASQPDYADATDGLLGLYIGAFPRKQPDGSIVTDPSVTNDSGFARWAGTSFAAPIVSGLLALLCAQGNSLDDAAQILIDAQKAASEATQGEVVLLEQG
jgi:hypothetical protein